VRIETVDPDDDAAFEAWSAVRDAVDDDVRPGEVDATPTARRAFLRRGRDGDADERVLALLARDGSSVVGAAVVELPLRDNLHYAELAVAVLPEARRRGVGTALAEQGERLAREHGRTTLSGPVDEPPGVPSAGRAFALGRGYAEVLVETRRDIDLPLDPDRVRRLTQECAPYASAFTVRTWHGPCPAALVDDLAVLLQRMSTDAPTGEADWREETWDAARVREHEQLVLAQGRTLYAAGAVHDATGQLVAFTRVGVEDEVPGRAHQWETLVLREHRGARLGTLLKLACLQDVAQRSPATRLVTTWNAAVNAPMIRVNDALGARTNGAMSFWQKVEGPTG
jgi:GNAT superfamily N-acetyltransferase